MRLRAARIQPLGGIPLRAQSALNNGHLLDTSDPGNAPGDAGRPCSSNAAVEARLTTEGRENRRGLEEQRRR